MSARAPRKPGGMGTRVQGAHGWLVLLLACGPGGSLGQTLYAPCDAPRRQQLETPVCEAIYPTTVRYTGGERVIMAFSGLNVPWYVKSQFDPCPWSRNEWRGASPHTAASNSLARARHLVDDNCCLRCRRLEQSQQPMIIA